MSGQYSERAAVLAEKLYRVAYLIIGDEVSAEKLVLDTLRNGKSVWLAVESEYAFQISLFKMLIHACFNDCAKYKCEQLSMASELKKLVKLERTVVVLSCFVGFNETDACKILGIPKAIYKVLLKKSVPRLVNFDPTQ